VSRSILDMRLEGASLTTRSVEAASFWAYEDIEVAIQGMAAFADFEAKRPMEWLLIKVRGALGRVLLQSASPGRQAGIGCDWPATCSSEVFFGLRKAGIATPWILWAGSEGSALVVRARVFGLSREWAPALADALVIALRTHIPWATLSRDLQTASFSQAPWVEAGGLALELRRKSIGGLPAVVPPNGVQISFLTHTPFRLEKATLQRAGGCPIPQFDTLGWLGSALPRRLWSLAPWMGVCPKALSEAAALAVSSAKGEQTTKIASACGKRSGGHHRADPARVPPPIYLRQPDQAVFAALRIAEICGVGRATVIGCGQFELQAIDM